MLPYEKGNDVTMVIGDCVTPHQESLLYLCEHQKCISVGLGSPFAFGLFISFLFIPLWQKEDLTACIATTTAENMVRLTEIVSAGLRQGNSMNTNNYEN